MLTMLVVLAAHPAPSACAIIGTKQLVQTDEARSGARTVAIQSRNVARFGRQQSTPVTNFLLVANGVAFVALARRSTAFRALAKDDAMIRSNLAQSYRLVSSCFLHANVAHLLVNAYSLNTLGHAVEPWFGSRRAATVYATAGLAGNLLSLRTRAAPISVGASGCIFGLLGAWAVFLHSNRAFFSARGVDVGESLTRVLESCALNALFGLRPGSMIDNVSRGTAS